MAETNDILDRLIDLIKQATHERSHYYVGNCAKDAINEIIMLRLAVATLREKKGKQ